jgi:hypothetical protein
MSKDLILKKIGTIGKAAKKLTSLVQDAAVDCALHAVQHGDVTLADQLVEALGKGMRRASLRAWFERHTPMYLPKGKDKFAFDSDRAKTMRKTAPEELRESLLALPWEEAKPEDQVVSIYDVSDAVDKFLKRVNSMVNDANITVKNRGLLEQLISVNSRYHAEQVLKERIALPAEEPKA